MAGYPEADITEHNQAEEALKESERRYATVLSNARAYVYRCRNDPGYPNEFASDYALDLTGYPPEELLVGGSVRFGELIVEEDRQRVWEEVQGALVGGERFELRYAIRRRDGELRNVEEFGQGVYDEEGDVVALEGMVYDVTERERVVERLREAEARYRTLVEQVPVVIYTQEIEHDNAISYISPRVEEIMGYSPQEYMHDPDLWIKTTHPEDRERVLAEVARTDETGEPFRIECRKITRDGRVIWVRDETVLVKTPEGKPLYWQGVIFDVTERKALEEQLEYQAFHDPLTGLPNRTLFTDRLRQALA